MERKRNTVALVMGAGGPLGHAFHAGVLRALADGCGWDARSADLVVGTSAGAVAGALLRAGLSGHDLYSAVSGGSPLLRTLLHPPPADDRARRWPASTDYLRLALRRPWRARPGRLVSALLPEGAYDNQQLGALIAELHPERWPERPLWVTAVSLDSGARVAFGRHDAPLIDIGTAVRCSAAVPWLRRPVEVADQRFVDGGIASGTHVDLLSQLAESPPQLVLVSSPLSRYLPMKLLLRAELRALAPLGARIVVFEPDAQVARAMSWNPMDARLTSSVAAAAYRAALARLDARELEGLRAVLAGTG
jgi:NTE family protein